MADTSDRFTDQKVLVVPPRTPEAGVGMTSESGRSPNMTGRLQEVHRLLRTYLVVGCLGAVVIFIAVVLGLRGSIPAAFAVPLFAIGGLLLAQFLTYWRGRRRVDRFRRGMPQPRVRSALLIGLLYGLFLATATVVFTLVLLH